jgi:hypothetical protein
MQVVLTIRESNYGLWCICTDSVLLVDRLQFAPAIRMARRLAREEQVRSGCAACVEMACPEFTIDLARFDAPKPLSMLSVT